MVRRRQSAAEAAGSGLQGVPAVRRPDLRGARERHAGRRGEPALCSSCPPCRRRTTTCSSTPDAETPATVPAPGLAATTRAYAKVIEEVNKMELKELQLPAPAATQAQAR